MRLNKWLVLAGAAPARRKADELITSGRVDVDGSVAQPGMQVTDAMRIAIDGQPLELAPLSSSVIIALNKPRGYVCSHRHQGESPTIFELLPEQYHRFSIIGRLDKDSEGLVLLASDGELTYRLTHPSHRVSRCYEVTLDHPISTTALQCLLDGVELDDGLSQFDTASLLDAQTIRVGLHTGRKHQIRRTLKAIGYEVIRLRRLSHGDYSLGELPIGKWREEQSWTA